MCSLQKHTEGNGGTRNGDARETALFFTCEDGFVRLEFPPAYGQRDVAEFLVFEEKAEVVRQPALWNFELYGVALPGNVHAVRHHAHLQHAASLEISRPRRTRLGIDRNKYRVCNIQRYIPHRIS